MGRQLAHSLFNAFAFEFGASGQRRTVLGYALCRRVVSNCNIRSGVEGVRELERVIRRELEFAFAERVLNAWIKLFLEFVIITDADDSDFRILKISLRAGTRQLVEEIVTVANRVDLVNNNQNRSVKRFDFLIELIKHRLLRVARGTDFGAGPSKLVHEFHVLGVKPLILQRGPGTPTLEHNALIRSKGYSQGWMVETFYSTM